MLSPASIERTPDMISGKWTTIRTYVGKFTEIHNNNLSKPLPSGWNDENLYDFSCAEYKQDVKVDFNKKHLWEFLRHVTKWKECCKMGQKRSVAKRSKTSSTSAPVPEPEPDHQAFSDSAPNDVAETRPRPQGRNRSRGAAAASSSGPSIATDDPVRMDISNISRHMGDMVEIAHLRILTQNYDHLPEKDRRIMEMTKDKIRSKYNLPDM